MNEDEEFENLKEMKLIFSYEPPFSFENVEKEEVLKEKLNANHAGFGDNENIKEIQKSGYITLNFNDQERYITKKNFDDIYNRSQQWSYEGSSVSSQIPDRQEAKDELSANDVRLSVDSVKFFLNDSFGSFQIDTGIKLSIESNIDQVFHLPWEDLDENVKYVERVLLGQKLAIQIKNDDLLFLFSHSYQDDNNKLWEGASKEIKCIIELLEGPLLNPKRGDSIEKFKIESILIQRHLNKKCLLGLKNTEYKVIHLISHGDKNGILLEKEENFRTPDLCSVEDLSSIFLKKKIKAHLFFLASCYSGIGKVDCDSLAFQLLKKGICKYVIAYSSGVGKNDHAPEFANRFYSGLVQQDEGVKKNNIIERSFFSAKKQMQNPINAVIYKI